MKKLITIIACAVVAFSSCTKTKTIDVIQNDTTTIVKNDTTAIIKNDTLQTIDALIGQWSDGINGDAWPTFATDYVSYKGSNTPTKYAASADSIYVMGTNDVYFTAYYYQISTNNDTLWLTNITNPSFPTTKYTKVN